MLMYISKKGNRVPITAIKVITVNSVILLSGEVIKDDNPNFTDMGSEVDTTSTVVINSLTKLAGAVDRTTKDLNDRINHLERSISEINGRLANAAKKSEDTVERIASSQNRITRESKQVIELANDTRKMADNLGNKLNGYIQEFEAQVAGIEATA